MTSPRPNRLLAATLALLGLLASAVPAAATGPRAGGDAGAEAVAAGRTRGDLGAARAIDLRAYDDALRVVARREASDAPADPSAARSSAANRQNFVGNNFFDFCGDQGRFDLKKFSILDDRNAEVILVWGTCPQSPAPRTADDAVAFVIDDGETYAGPNLVVVQEMSDASFVVYDTNGSTREQDWTPIDSGVGRIDAVGTDRGGPRTVGEIPVDAFATSFPLEFLVAVTTFDANGTGDLVPEPEMPVIAFPFSCDYFTLHAASVRATSGRALAAAATEAQARGLHVSATNVPGGTMLVSGVDEADLAALDRLPHVEAERPAVYEHLSTGDPEPNQWALDQTNLPRAWTAVPRASLRIAVLDQGVDGQRPDLGGRVGQGYNANEGVPSSERLWPAGHDSALGPHGTSVAGVAAAERGNGVAVAGVNEGATILPVLVFDHANCANDASIAAGLDWAVERGARVVNLSLGGPRDSSTLRAAVDRAVAKGAILLAATGNNGDTQPNTPSYPAAYADVIGIGATAPGPVVASYSQAAATDYVAPGGSSSGQRADDMAVLGEWDRVEFQAGTSFAAPFVAGLVSLWLSQNPSATLAQVRAALTAAAVDIPGTTRDGRGYLDAVALLGEDPDGDPDPDPDPSGVPPAPPIDGDPATFHRLDQAEAVAASLAVSGLRFPKAGAAPVAVLARRDTFADALSGAPLTSEGPMLFTDRSTLDTRVRDEVERVLAPNGTIYLLGGPGALSEDIAAQLRRARPDATVRRLAGTNRFETSRAIVRETVARYGRASQLQLARGFGPASDPNGTAAWADAIAAGAYAASRRQPILVVQSANLGPTDLAVIDEVVRPEGLVNLLGGPAALSDQVLASAGSVREARRVRGSDRAGTAAAIASTLFGVLPDSGERRFVPFNPYVASGWYLGLASAGYAASIGAPLVAVSSTVVPEPTAALVGRCGPKQVELWIAGSTGQVPAAMATRLEELDGKRC